MGVAIAESAWRRGAEVVLIAGPLSIDAPVGPRMVPVETTGEMLTAVRQALGGADVLVMAAAPADFRAASVATSKVKKANAPESIPLESTPDILRETIGDRPPGMIAVGFALETDDVLRNGEAKLASKELDLIVTNDALEPGAGFTVDTNRVTLLSHAMRCRNRHDRHWWRRMRRCRSMKSLPGSSSEDRDASYSAHHLSLRSRHFQQQFPHVRCVLCIAMRRTPFPVKEMHTLTSCALVKHQERPKMNSDVRSLDRRGNSSIRFSAR